MFPWKLFWQSMLVLLVICNFTLATGTKFCNPSFKHIANGILWLPRIAGNSSIRLGVTCNIGYKPDNGALYRCTLNKNAAYYQGTQLCTVIDNYCPDFATGGRLRTFNRPSSRRIGTKVRRNLSCGLGLWAGMTCVSLNRNAGVWKGDTTCRPIANFCPDLNTVNAHGRFHMPHRSVGALARLNCDRGYTNKLDQVLRCVANTSDRGTWVGNAVCSIIDFYCPAIPHGINFQSTLRQVGTVTRRVPACAMGFRAELRCTAHNATHGVWAGTTKCTAIPNYCSGLKSGDGRSGFFLSSAGQVGSVVRLGCFLGYGVKSKSALQCTPKNATHGVWKGKAVCTQIVNYCFPLTDKVGQNGVFSITGGRQIGAEARLVCDQGYETKPEEVVRCIGFRKDFGQWNGTAACRPIANFCRDISAVQILKLRYSVSSSRSIAASNPRIRQCVPGQWAGLQCTPTSATNGKWVEEARCRPVKCKVPKASHLLTGETSSTFDIGKVLTLSCQGAYILRDAVAARCHQSNKASGIGEVQYLDSHSHQWTPSISPKCEDPGASLNCTAEDIQFVYYREPKRNFAEGKLYCAEIGGALPLLAWSSKHGKQSCMVKVAKSVLTPYDWADHFVYSPSFKDSVSAPIKNMAHSRNYLANERVTRKLHTMCAKPMNGISISPPQMRCPGGNIAFLPNQRLYWVNFTSAQALCQQYGGKMFNGVQQRCATNLLASNYLLRNAWIGNSTDPQLPAWGKVLNFQGTTFHRPGFTLQLAICFK